MVVVVVVVITRYAILVVDLASVLYFLELKLIRFIPRKIIYADIDVLSSILLA